MLDGVEFSIDEYDLVINKINEISTVESHLEEQLSSLEKIYRRADIL